MSNHRFEFRDTKPVFGFMGLGGGGGAKVGQALASPPTPLTPVLPSLTLRGGNNTCNLCSFSLRYVVLMYVYLIPNSAIHSDIVARARPYHSSFGTRKAVNHSGRM